jgi:hypothetical protein
MDIAKHDRWVRGVNIAQKLWQFKAESIVLSDDCRSMSAPIAIPDLKDYLAGIADFYNSVPEELKDAFNKKPANTDRTDFLIEYIEYARAHIERKESSNLKQMLVLIAENYEALKTANWAFGVGKQYGENAKRKSELAQAEKWKPWKKEADKIRAERPGQNLSLNYLGETVKSRLKASETAKYIAAKIGKLDQK